VEGMRTGTALHRRRDGDDVDAAAAQQSNARMRTRRRRVRQDQGRARRPSSLPPPPSSSPSPSCLHPLSSPPPWFVDKNRGGRAGAPSPISLLSNTKGVHSWEFVLIELE
jgi:hypothetical protein